MDFNFSEEQQQYGDALRRWIDKDYGFEVRQRIVQSAAGVSDDAWHTLTELGMLALPVPAAQGGFDGDAVDLLVVMQELGRGLVVEPYFATVWGAYFLRLAGNQYHLLQDVAEGRVKLACALGEKHARYDLADIKTLAAVNGEGYRIDGTKTVVLHGAQADALIVSARSAGSQRDANGISLFVVPADTPGVTRRDYRTLDGQRAATVQFSHVAVPASALLGRLGGGFDLLDEAADHGVSLLCSEALGVMDALFSSTLDYVKTRRQFGVAIGSFQSLQHRMADMYIHLEQARSMAMLASARMSCGDPRERRRILSAAKVRVGQAARFIGQQAVQLHGGMGVTDELPASHHFKRLTAIEHTLGDTDHHLERYTASGADPDAAKASEK
ncbi:pimeloyl-CoA dehydrogenase small subunit [Duganella sp. Leaf126]|uniref:acyl-CoA dehydrogenase family protein n=1 Tax=Duganella sp. Leaf126 TaxID=1736266 RepID=UPI0006F78811|nr:acyl-CoA dehydrogenase family protein [Duganella sp. Leaf126]KQQ40306.1 pimeloyl-CoA dehydrogenase small subunit [Duganella sp. Leaf126]